MVNKELKKLNRRDLMDIIYQMKKNEQQMQDQITSMQSELQDKRLRLSKAGSISEAAAAITDVFSAAQKTADLYLDEISCMKEDAQKESKKIIEEAKQTAEKLISDAEKILSDAKKKQSVLQEYYETDYIKWQQLQAEIKKLELRKEELAKNKGI